MKPVTREGAKILNDLDGIRRRMKNWLAKVDTHGLCPWVSTVPPQRKIAPPLTNILIYGNIIVNGNACPKQETLPTLRRIVVAPEGGRSEALRKVQDSLLEQAEASKEDESMTPKSPPSPKEHLSTCYGIMCGMCWRGETDDFDSTENKPLPQVL